MAGQVRQAGTQQVAAPLPLDIPRPATTSSSAPLLVALHGWLLSGRLWQPLAAQLSPRWQLWAPDLPGFGRAPRPRGLQPSLASYGRWVAEAVRAELARAELAGSQAAGRPVVLLGHSLGASVAIEAAPHLGSQLQALVAIAAGGGVYQPRPFQLVRRFGVPMAAAASLWRGERRAATGLLACSTGRGAVRQLPQRVAALTVPSLWIAGGRDQVMEERYVRHLAGYSPMHSIGRLPAAGHLPMRSDPAALAALIEPWLRDTLAASAPAAGQGSGSSSLPSIASPLSWSAADCA
ncbi:MAG: alpha/beta fold hydrolase [Prochlorococcaceae cyanobacterium]